MRHDLVMLRRMTCVLVVLLAGVAACDSSADPTSGAGGGGGTTSDGGGGGASLCTTTETPTGPNTLYLAFDGVTLEGVADGEDDATTYASSFVTGSTAFPPFREGDPDRQAVIDTLLADVEQALAPFALTLTTQRPAGDHLMIVYAGQDGGELIGLVRHDCDAVVRNDVVIFFENVADPERGRYAMANETIFAVTRSIGLAKSKSPGHPCSCDPSGTCTNESLCAPTADAEVSFSACPGTGNTQDEIAAFAAVFGCD